MKQLDILPIAKKDYQSVALATTVKNSKNPLMGSNAGIVSQA